MFGGALADRMQKKRVLILGLLCSAVVSLGIALALMTGILGKENEGSWWILIASSFVQGVIMGLMLPARQSIIPEIVSREQAMNAVALNTLGMNVLRFLAPGLAGILIDAFDFKSIFFTMCGLNLYAAVFIMFVPHTSRLTSRGNSILADIKEGFNYVKKEKTILYILGFTLIAVVLSMPYQQLLPIFVDDILKVGATGMGLLLSVSGAGAMVGSLVLASLPNRKRGLILLASSLISGVALVIFSFSTVWMLSLVFIVFVGLGQTIRGTLSSALLQSYVEGPYMGRVMSILMMEWGVVSLVTFIAGLMAEIMPVQWVVSSLAFLLITLTLLALIFVPRFRKVD
jgi:MFS family permease